MCLAVLKAQDAVLPVVIYFPDQYAGCSGRRGGCICFIHVYIVVQCTAQRNAARIRGLDDAVRLVIEGVSNAVIEDPDVDLFLEIVFFHQADAQAFCVSSRGVACAADIR